MNILIFLLLLYVSEIIVISCLYRLFGWKGIVFTASLNMAFIAFFGDLSFTIFGLASNYGNIAYAAVFYGVSLLASEFSFKETVKIVSIIFFTSFLSLIISGHGQLIVASFFSFWLANVINVIFVQKEKKVLGNIFGQFVDSIIFFPLAFGSRLPWNIIFQYLVLGFAIKTTLNILDTPVFFKMKKK